MNPRIVTVELPTTIQPGELLNRGRGDATQVVVVARSGRNDRPAPLLRDLLTSGFDAEPDQTRRRENELGRIVTARLTGIPVRHILVVCSENLSPSDVGLLVGLSQRCGTDLTLAYGIDAGAQVRAQTARNGAVDIEWDDLVLPDNRAAEVAAEARPFPDRVPASDFPLFLHTASQVLSPEDYAIVSETYWDAYDTTLSAGLTTSEDAADHLQGLLAMVSSTAEATTIARGAQAAHVINGYLLKLDMRSLRLTVDEGHHRRLSSADLHALGALIEPWQSAAVVLSDAGVDNATMLSLTVGDIAQDGTPPQPPLPLRDEGLAWLRVQRDYRRLEGATRDDLLLDVRDRQISTAMRAAAALGLGIDTRRNFTRKPDRWRNRTGLVLKDLS